MEKLNGKAPEGLVSFIVGFVDHLNELGFDASNEVVSDFFCMCADRGVRTLEDVEMTLRPLVVKNAYQNAAFHSVFSNYAENGNRIVVDEQTEKELRGYLSQRDELLAECDRLDRRIAERQAGAMSDETAGEPANKKPAREYEDVKLSFQKVLSRVKDKELRRSLREYARGDSTPLSKEEIKSMRDGYCDMLVDAMFTKDYVKLMDYIRKQIKRLDRQLNHIGDIEQTTDEMHDDCMLRGTIQKELCDIEAAIGENVRTIEKNSSFMHRQEFFSTGNAVWCDSEGEVGVFDKKLSELAKTEKQQIYDYIRDNTRKFRTKLLRCIYTNERQKLDIKRTCKGSIATGGLPLRLYYKNKISQRPRAVLILDISGSCADASELMLFFTYCMKEVFTGGFNAYVFVNRLYDITGILEESNAENVIEKVYESIPTRGGYSDYYMPLKTFYEEHMSEVGDNTFVFFMGDARNNKNKSGEEYIKAISARSRKTFWLCTEEQEKWNKMDSIIGLYAPYMTRMGEVLTANQLLAFLMHI